MPGNCLLVISKNEGVNPISIAEQAIDSGVVDKVIISDGSNEETFKRLKKKETKKIEVISEKKYVKTNEIGKGIGMINGGLAAIEQDFDTRYVITSLEFVRELLSYEEEVSFLEIKLDPRFPADRVQEEIIAIMGDHFSVKNSQQQNELFYRVMKSEKWAIFLILTFILVIASFNIIGSLSMLIIDKKSDIVTLRNMGANNRLIGRIFLVEGWLISLIGSVIGMILGVSISWIQQQFGIIKLTGSGTFVIDAYPVQIEIPDILLIWATVLFIGLIAARYPVRQISRKYLRSLEKEGIV